MPDETPTPEPNDTPQVDRVENVGNSEAVQKLLKGLRKRHREVEKPRPPAHEIVQLLKERYKQNLDEEGKTKILNLLKKMKRPSNLQEILTRFFDEEELFSGKDMLNEDDQSAIFTLLSLSLTMSNEGAVAEIKTHPELITDALKQLLDEKDFF